MGLDINRSYLDFNASAPLRSGVKEAVFTALASQGNPSSVHQDGRKARKIIEDTRDSISHIVGMHSNSIIFTSCGTEANVTIIADFLANSDYKEVFCSAIEHPSILEYVRPSRQIRVDKNGVIDLDYLETVLKKVSSPFLFCLMLANNETGVIQPVSAASEIVHMNGGVVLCDCVQALGKLELDLNQLKADFFSFSGHKIGAPKGVGCLVAKSDANYSPLMRGGGQERSLRSGTENVSGIAGFGAAVQTMKSSDEINYLKTLRDDFEQSLLRARDDAYIIGDKVSRIPNTTSVAIRGVSSESQLMKLDLAGFSVSSGSACSSGKITESHVLKAMGISPDLLGSSIRVSSGFTTTEKELQNFVDVWSSI